MKKYRVIFVVNLESSCNSCSTISRTYKHIDRYSWWGTHINLERSFVRALWSLIVPFHILQEGGIIATGIFAHKKSTHAHIWWKYTCLVHGNFKLICANHPRLEFEALNRLLCTQGKNPSWKTTHAPHERRRMPLMQDDGVPAVNSSGIIYIFVCFSKGE